MPFGRPAPPVEFSGIASPHPPLEEPHGTPGWITPPAWESLPWLWSGFSTRQGGVSRVYLPALASSTDSSPGIDGDLNLGFTADDSEAAVRENRLRFVESITGSRQIPLVPLRQVHSNRTVVINLPPADAIPEADGSITRMPGLLLGIQTADCIPVLVVDVEQRVVAAFHAGWRGTVERIVESGVHRMRDQFGCKPTDLQAAIGPGIGACCYAVGSEVHDRFSQNFDYARGLFRNAGLASPAPQLHLDLREANRRQLVDAGLNPNAISLVGGCTSCRPDLYFSHRASGGRTGRMMAAIGIRSSGE